MPQQFVINKILQTYYEACMTHKIEDSTVLAIKRIDNTLIIDKGDKQIKTRVNIR